jgi:branched-subunit amino acid ABC-type transport system permease component
MWPFVISGLVVGAIYGMSAVGLVLTYKASGIFNFAQGAVATVSAYTFYELHVLHGVNWPVAAAVAVLGVGLVLGLLFERLGRALSGASLAVQVTSTVGVLLIVQAAIVLIYGTTETRIVPVFLASGQFEIAGTFVQYADLVTFVVAVVATIVLYALFRFARLGRSMRALVDDSELLALTGTNISAVRRWAWLIGITFAGASGVLFCTVQPLDPTLLTLLVVQAFGAAAIGAFRNLPVTFLGGLFIGVFSSLCTKWFTTGILQGLPSACPFVVLFVVLLVFPRRFLAGRARIVPRARDGWQAPPRVQGGIGIAAIVFFAVVPTFAGIHINDWTIGLANLVVFLSLGLLVRESGQLSLGHVGFMAIGVTTFAHLADKGVPWIVALLAAMLIAVPIGALLAIPAIRLTGLYLALATLGFGILLQYMLYTQDFMFGFSGAGLEVPRPHWLGMGDDKHFYYLVLVLAVVFALVVMALVRGRLGRLLRGVADSPTALSTSGTSVLPAAAVAELPRPDHDRDRPGAVVCGVRDGRNGDHPELHHRRGHDVLAADRLRRLRDPSGAHPGLRAGHAPGGEATAGPRRRPPQAACALVPRGVGRSASRGKRRSGARGGGGALRRHRRCRRLQPDRGHRARHRTDRPERRRQDDHVQRRVRSAASQSGSRPVGREGHHTDEGGLPRP